MIPVFTDPRNRLKIFSILYVSVRPPSWNQLSKRIGEEKYWSYINFVGHIETISQDAERLLRTIGAWNDCCREGWTKNGFETFFESKSYSKLVPIDEVRLLVSSDLESLLDDFYQDDYEVPFMNLTKIHLNNDTMMMS